MPIEEGVEDDAGLLANMPDAAVVSLLPSDVCDSGLVPPDLKHAPESTSELHSVVWKLAWPSVVTMLLQTFNSFMDRGFVGQLGPDALAAVGVAGQLMFVIFSLGMSISIGATALVARFTGSGETDQARIAGNQALWIGWIAALASVALMLPLSHSVINLMHINAHAGALCHGYLVMSLAGVPALFVMLILSGAYRGIGDTFTPLIVSIGVNLIHLTGDYLLIFGSFGAPKLGLTGGAIALVTSQIIGSIFYALMLRRSPLTGLIRRKVRLEAAWAKRILNIGIPAALQNMSRILSMLCFTGVLARSIDSTAAVAALTIGLTSEGIAFMPGFGFSVAASTLTGQNLGAKRPDRAERAAWISLQQGIAVMSVMGVVFFVFAEQFAHIFTHDPAVVRLAVAYLRISAISEPFLALGMILTGALNGAGDTRGPAWAGAITMWGLRLPLGYLGAITWHYGAIGAWWGMAISTTVLGIASYGLFKWGRWKNVKV